MSFSSSFTKKSPPTQPEEEVPVWHVHTPEEVLALLDVTEAGLSDTEWHRRFRKFGPNQFTKQRHTSWAGRLFGQVRSPLIIILLCAFAVTAALGEYLDAGVILFALCTAIGIGILQEGRASGAFQKLADSQIRLATVIRSGKKHEIEAQDLVLGDIVELQSGGQVPADIRLLQVKNLSINQAVLTGEWLGASKEVAALEEGMPLAEQANMAFMGTYVATGNGLGVVVATGDETSVGELAEELQTIVDEKTPLQHEMERISMVLFYIFGALVLVIFSIGLWQGQSLHDMLLLSIAVAVASVPEGLPAAVTIILAVGMESLLRRGGLVRNLLAAETLGSTTFVLTDKTGTLTKARMAVTGVIHGGNDAVEVTDFTADPLVRELLDVALCAADAYIDETGKEAVVRGDPVEKAILEAAYESGITPGEDSLRAVRCDYLAFNSDNRFAAGLVHHGERQRLCINGAPELLLTEATGFATGDGVMPLTSSARDEFIEALGQHTQEGKRLIGVGYKEVACTEIAGEATETLLAGCVFLGILILHDPVRPGIKKAIEGVHSAGAEVLLVTGDNPQTALSIARQVGIAERDEVALTGDDIATLSDEELLAVVREVHVFARVLPKQKMRLAEVLQKHGEIVAMTGDGVNDAPALRKANIGIAVGSGTEVAKEASDLVLVDDSFATIYAAIEEGRRIIANLRKIIGYLLSTSLSEVVLIAAALLVAAPVPLLPVQILWANIIEEGLMSVAFAFEPGEKRAMQRRPQDIHEEGVLSLQMLSFLAFVVTILSGLLLLLYFYVRSLQLPLEELRSVMFVAVSMDSLFIAFAFRSLVTPIWHVSLRDNRFFIGSFLISLLLLFAALTIPFMQQVLSYTPLPWQYIALAVGFSAVALVVIECGKALFFHYTAPEEAMLK